MAETLREETETLGVFSGRGAAVFASSFLSPV